MKMEALLRTFEEIEAMLLCVSQTPEVLGWLDTARMHLRQAGRKELSYSSQMFHLKEAHRALREAVSDAKAAGSF